MIPLSDIEWGPTDAAEPDDRFVDKFVEPRQIRLLLHPRFCIITGEKGSGKTALRQAFLQKYKDKFTGIVDLDFDDLEYSSILCNLNQLAQITNLPRLSLMMNYWQYVLIIQAMKNYVARKAGSMSPGYALIHNYLTKNGLIEASHLRLFLSVISKCWTFIDSYTRPHEYKGAQGLPFLPSNLTPEIVEQIKHYPMLNPEFREVAKTFSGLLATENEAILALLDGFDRFENKAGIQADVNLIFESLVEAAYSISINRFFHKSILVKALIPHDRFLSINLRDTDKFDAKQRSIKWNPCGLRQFLVKRMQLHPKLGAIQDFDRLWDQVMPSTVENHCYNITENSYDYILRHTMYRPRHLQIHLEKLADLNYDRVITDRAISSSLKESCEKIVGFYLKEYYIDHPNLERFLTRFHKRCNIMPFGELEKIVEQSLRDFKAEQWTVPTKLETLYEMGFFGVIQKLKAHQIKGTQDTYTPPRKAGVDPYRVMFYYKSPRSKVVKRLQPDDLIAIHPIFFDYADMTPHENMIVG